MTEKFNWNEFINEYLTAKDPKKRLIRNLSLILIVVLFVCVLYANASQKESDKIDYTYADHVLTVMGPQNEKVSIDLAKAWTIDLIQRPELGEMVEGIRTNHCLCGTYVNRAWGTYTLLAEQDLPDFIVITLPGQTIAFNVASSRETDALFEILKDQQKEQAQGGGAYE